MNERVTERKSNRDGRIMNEKDGRWMWGEQSFKNIIKFKFI